MSKKLFQALGAPDEGVLCHELALRVQRSHLAFLDCYFQQDILEQWSLEQGVVKDASYQRACGVGLRSIAGESQALAYSEKISLPSIRDCVEHASSLPAAAQIHSATHSVHAHHQDALDLYAVDDLCAGVTDQQKVQALVRADQIARSLDERVIEVMLSISINDEHVWIVNSEGLSVVDHRPLVRFNAQVVMEAGIVREQGYSGYGGRYDLASLLCADKIDACVAEAVRLASVALSAQPAPAGVMPVVLGPGWPGILLHEAIGHGLEADFHRRETSAFTGKLGEQIAAPGCTVVDDACLPNARGSINIDDEGEIGQRTVLIKDGVLTSLMTDRFNADMLGMQRTGNGRRESYATLPMPRMTNTLMLPGQHDPAELISAVDEGIYAVNFAGGQVDITSGHFVFEANEAYRVRNGQIGEPIKGVMLVGDGASVLKQISMIGHDASIDPGVGTCGKDGQSVVVGVGQPSLLVDGLTVGGTE